MPIATEGQHTGQSRVLRLQQSNLQHHIASTRLFKSVNAPAARLIPIAASFAVASAPPPTAPCACAGTGNHIPSPMPLLRPLWRSCLMLCFPSRNGPDRRRCTCCKHAFGCRHCQGLNQSAAAPAKCLQWPPPLSRQPATRFYCQATGLDYCTQNVARESASADGPPHAPANARRAAGAGRPT
mgnify:CR=1 FL=1